MEKKKLYRSETDRAIAGVCGGIAEYFEVDSIVIRLAFVLFGLAFGSGLLFYIVAACIIPRRPYGMEVPERQENTDFEYRTAGSDEPFTGGSNKGANTGKAIGWLMVVLGALIFLRRFIPSISSELVVGVIIIIAGLYFVFRKN